MNNRLFILVLTFMGSGVACREGSTGKPGANGENVVMTPEPAGTNCPAGGVKLQVGDGPPTYVCNGATGPSGTGQYDIDACAEAKADGISDDAAALANAVSAATSRGWPSVWDASSML